ncbi:hypothetical protein [Zavarzinella formosa]|uniref:hypothetical protein n=1 Tax=Zavarzinella formosa TaxID=360055 RepID=UPI0002EAC6E7|nr:hypothetical protein [Zavarzinella formosa]
MIRHTLSLLLMVGMTAWVGGQTPTALKPQYRAQLYKQNRVVIERLVEKTVTSARTPNDHLKRADGYYKLLFQFNTEITQAIDRKDQARVNELTRHLQTLLDQGLAPTLEDARRQVEGGTGAAEFPVVKDQLLSQLDSLLNTLSEDATAKQSLTGAKDRLLKVRSNP